MNKFKYYKISNSKKIRYLQKIEKDSTYIVFLHGFMSDLEGKKPKAFLNFAKKNKFGFLALEYSGHGKSSGKFTQGNITKWSKETSLLIKRVINKEKFVLVGSSMGAWIALNQFKIFKNQIKSFLGIGSAPDFLENLMWKKFSKMQKKKLLSKGIIHLKHCNYVYPITYQLIKDGRKNRILNKSIRENLKVTMVHGENDEAVPVKYSKKVLKIFKKGKKKLVIVKKGDHSLSSKKWLKLITMELERIV